MPAGRMARCRGWYDRLWGLLLCRREGGTLKAPRLLWLGIDADALGALCRDEVEVRLALLVCQEGAVRGSGPEREAEHAQFLHVLFASLGGLLASSERSCL